MTELERAVVDLAESRRATSDVAERLAALDHLIAEQFPQFALLQKALFDAKVTERLKEEELRALAVDGFDGQNKKPHAAVTLGKYVVLDYDPGAAKRYAVEHLPDALKLDKSAFEKAAKVIPLDFVTARAEVRAKIAADLSGYLPDEPPL